MIEVNVSIKNLNTFGLDVSANSLVPIVFERKVPDIVKAVKNKKYLILGGGSNILFTRDFDGVVLHNQIKGIRRIEDIEDKVLIEAGAGEIWHEFVLHCLENNWYGLENLSLIPGTVGASPIQNIGAYGVEILDVMHSVDYYDITTDTFNTLENHECNFGYRDSIFKNELKGTFVITKVRFLLSKVPNLKLEYGAIKDTLLEMGISDPSPKDVSNAVIAIRSSKLPNPAEIGNCGSFFKNPVIANSQFESLKAEYPNIPSFPAVEGYVKVPAAWLIDQDGWKGKTFGEIGVHKNQALVLVNYGGGKGEDIKNLAYQIIESVKTKFGIELTPEVNIV